MDCVEMIVSS